MVLIVVEAVRASSKPPLADDSMRTSTGGRYCFGAAVTSLTRAPPMHFSGAGGSTILPNLVKLIGPSSTRAEEVSSCFSSSAAAPSVRLRVLFSVFTSASVARRGC